MAGGGTEFRQTEPKAPAPRQSAEDAGAESEPEPISEPVQEETSSEGDDAPSADEPPPSDAPPPEQLNVEDLAMTGEDASADDADGR